MSSAVLTVVAGNVAGDALGVKEAVAMALEHLGGVRVTQVRIVEDEQLSINSAKGTAGGAAKPQSAAHRKPAVYIDCCCTCVRFAEERGADERGKLYWGICKRTGKPVYDMKNRCGAWARAGG